jgi:hypothetical protein
MTSLELILIIGNGVIVLVVLIETIILSRLSHHYNHFLKGNNQGLMGLLEGIQKTLSVHEGKTAKLTSKIDDLGQDGLSHIQHIVMHRFNPFNNTGGDQSFILGLLDGHKNGIIITSLHSRENTRFYVKSVIGGEGDPHPLSDEEKKVLKKG